MRPENILAWSLNVEYGHPPSQPPFDQFGNSVVNVTANIKEWKREFQAQQVERQMQERVVREQNSNGPKIGSSKEDVEAYIKDWKHANIRQQREKQRGSSKEDVEAYINDYTGASVKQQGETEERERFPRQQIPLTLKPGSSNLDAEARLKDFRRQGFGSAERERIARQRRLLFPHTVPKEAPKPEPRAYEIAQMQRKPVPKSNDDTTPNPQQGKSVPKPNNDITSPPHALLPQLVLLRNGQTKKLENRATYTDRVRNMGYPEILCPLPMKEIDCTGAKVVKRKEGRQFCDEDRELDMGGLGLGDGDGSQGLGTQVLVGEKRG